jgi:hypothetical protein
MSDDVPIPPSRAQQFNELFLKLRINDQLDFYSDRGAEYKAAHRQVVIVRNVLLAVAALAGGAAAFAPENWRPVLGLVSAVLAALATAVTAYDTLMGFQHLEKIYRDAADNLKEAAIDWRVVTPENLKAEVDRVEEVFRSERGQWGQLLVTSAGPTPQPKPPTSAAPPPPQEPKAKPEE